MTVTPYKLNKRSPEFLSRPVIEQTDHIRETRMLFPRVDCYLVYVHNLTSIIEVDARKNFLYKLKIPSHKLPISHKWENGKGGEARQTPLWLVLMEEENQQV